MELKIGSRITFVVWGGCRIACPRTSYSLASTWLAQDRQTPGRRMHAAAFHLAARPLKVVFAEFSFLLALLASCEASVL